MVTPQNSIGEIRFAHGGVKPLVKCLNPGKKKGLQLLSDLRSPIEYGLLAWRLLLLFHAVMGQYMQTKVGRGD